MQAPREAGGQRAAIAPAAAGWQHSLAMSRRPFRPDSACALRTAGARSGRVTAWLVAAACALLPPAGAAAATEAAPPVDARCATARSRLAQEEAALVSLLQTIEDDRRARAACTNRSACEHYDASLAALARRKERREARIEGAQADVARQCKPAADGKPQNTQ